MSLTIPLMTVVIFIIMCTCASFQTHYVPGGVSTPYIEIHFIIYNHSCIACAIMCDKTQYVAVVISEM